MGLDMFLKVRKRFYNNATTTPEEERAAYAIILKASGLPPGEDHITVMIEVAYWRKAWDIHEWISSQYSDGVSNGATVGINRETLEELRDLCRSADHGFDADEAENTADQLTAVLDNPAFVGCYFSYYADW